RRNTTRRPRLVNRSAGAGTSNRGAGAGTANRRAGAGTLASDRAIVPSADSRTTILERTRVRSNLRTSSTTAPRQFPGTGGTYVRQIARRAVEQLFENPADRRYGLTHTRLAWSRTDDSMNSRQVCITR